jgi:arsenate reductase
MGNKQMDKIRVLFLCTGNSARSQMAEAILRNYVGESIAVFSAGLEPKPINPLTLQVLDENGIDTHGLYSKPLNEYMGKASFDYLITVCSNADKKCPFFPGMGKRLHWLFDDPAKFRGNNAEKLAKFREIRDGISERIRTWLIEMKIPVSS